MSKLAQVVQVMHHRRWVHCSRCLRSSTNSSGGWTSGSTKEVRRRPGRVTLGVSHLPKTHARDWTRHDRFMEDVHADKNLRAVSAGAGAGAMFDDIRQKIFRD